MKVCLICFDFTRRNIPLQPWRYMYEIASRMAQRGVDVEIISDSPDGTRTSDEVGGIRITYAGRFEVLSKNEELVQLIKDRSPDVLMLSMGPTSIYFMPLLMGCSIPVVGMWTGTIYNLGYILGLGPGEISRNRGSLYLHAISSVVPKNAVKYLLSSPNLKKIVVLNESSRSKVADYGFPSGSISVIPPGISEDDLQMPVIEELEELRVRLKIDEEDFIVLYIGSPLTLRGTDILIDAFSRALKAEPSMKLLLLSRRLPEGDPSGGESHLSREEMYLDRLINAKGIDNSVKVLPGFLSKMDLKRLMCLSDAIALPFKLVQSDVPIGILEAMALGRPVISTRIGGIPELLDDNRGILVEPNDPEDLSNAIIALYGDPDLGREIGDRARAYMLKYYSWDQIAEKTISAIAEIKG